MAFRLLTLVFIFLVQSCVMDRIPPYVLLKNASKRTVQINCMYYGRGISYTENMRDSTWTEKTLLAPNDSTSVCPVAYEYELDSLLCKIDFLEDSRSDSVFIFNHELINNLKENYFVVIQ